MKEAKLDHTDRGLLNLLQAVFPLIRQPFAELGASLGLYEGEVIERIGRLKRTQVIRNIGPVFDSRSLGYQSTLVAMRIPEERLERAVRIVNEHPGVSHNYARSDTFNLWFTLAVPPGDDPKKELQALVARVGPEEVLDLPAVRLFKLGVFFDVAGSGRVGGSVTAKPEPTLQPAATLSGLEQAVVRELQRDIPLTSRPFDAMAQRAGVGVDEFLSCCRGLLERGAMRRFGASLRHHRVGFAGNAMVCWRVPPPMVEEVGRVMSSFDEVSHCYERETSEGWPYNVFAMIHGRTRDDCLHTIGRIVEQTGVEEYRVLFTIKEFKKERVRLVAAA